MYILGATLNFISYCSFSSVRSWSRMQSRNLPFDSISIFFKDSSTWEHYWLSFFLYSTITGYSWAVTYFLNYLVDLTLFSLRQYLARILSAMSLFLYFLSSVEVTTLLSLSLALILAASWCTLSSLNSAISIFSSFCMILVVVGAFWSYEDSDISVVFSGLNVLENILWVPISMAALWILL